MSNFSVSNLNNSGAGSLRAAIESANASPATNVTISFEVAGTISLTSALPGLSKSVTMDATTAPGYVADGGPVVTLDFGGHAGLSVGLAAIDMGNGETAFI